MDGAFRGDSPQLSHAVYEVNLKAVVRSLPILGQSPLVFNRIDRTFRFSTRLDSLGSFLDSTFLLLILKCDEYGAGVDSTVDGALFWTTRHA